MGPRSLIRECREDRGSTSLFAIGMNEEIYREKSLSEAVLVFFPDLPTTGGCPYIIPKGRTLPEYKRLL